MWFSVKPLPFVAMVGLDQIAKNLILSLEIAFLRVVFIESLQESRTRTCPENGGLGLKRSPTRTKIPEQVGRVSTQLWSVSFDKNVEA